MFFPDQIYGNIRLPDQLDPLVKHDYMIRLKNIKQLSLVNLVFYSANHSRFEHSLGVAHLTNNVVWSLMEKEVIPVDFTFLHDATAAGLLHDIGHGPFGHVFEIYFSYAGIPVKHEEISRDLVLNELGAFLEKIGLDPTRIFQLLAGQRFSITKSGAPKIAASKILSSDGDVDRLDYIVRDAINTGVPYGKGVDVNTLLNRVEKVAVLPNGLSYALIYNDEALSAVSSLLLMRDLMYKRVYHHPINRSAQCMMSRSIYNYLETEGKFWKDIYFYTDEQLLKLVNESKDDVVREIISMLYNGETYIPLISIGLNDCGIEHVIPDKLLESIILKAKKLSLSYNISWINQINENIISILRKISYKCKKVSILEENVLDFIKNKLHKDFSKGEIFIDIPKPPDEKAAETYDVMFYNKKEDKLISLIDIATELYYYLKQASCSRWRAYVFSKNTLSTDEISKIRDFLIGELLS